jgi:hypothetical protein
MRGNGDRARSTVLAQTIMAARRGRRWVVGAGAARSNLRARAGDRCSSDPIDNRRRATARATLPCALRHPPVLRPLQDRQSDAPVWCPPSARLVEADDALLG